MTAVVVGVQRVEFQSLALFGFCLVRDPAAPQAQGRYRDKWVDGRGDRERRDKN